MAKLNYLHLAVVYLNIALYALFFRLQWRAGPAIEAQHPEQHFKVSVGRLNQVLQLFGSLGIGVLMDVVGIRRAFMVCFACSSLAYGMRWLAGIVGGSLEILYLSELPCIFQHSMLIAQTWVVSYVPEKGRIAAFAWLNMAYGIGAMWNDPVYDALARTGLGPYEIAALASVGSLVSVGLCLLLPAPPAPAKMDFLPVNCSSPLRALGFAKVRAFAVRPIIWSFMLLMITGYMLQTIVGATFGAVLGSKFPHGAERLGAALGILNHSYFVGLVTLGPVGRRLTPQVAVPAILLTQGCVQLVQAMVLTDALHVPMRHYPFLGFQYIITTTGWLLDTIMVIFVTMGVEKDERGTWMGVMHAWQTFPTLVSHSVAWTIFASGGAPGIYCAAAGLSFFMYFEVSKLVMPRYSVKAD